MPKEGDEVKCPSDRGNPGFDGVVVGLETDTHKSMAGNYFVWVTVRDKKSLREASWPSHRLGYRLPKSVAEVRLAEQEQEPAL